MTTQGTHTPGSHRHEFAVDASCECGVMLSALVRSLTRNNADLLSALQGVYEVSWHAPDCRTYPPATGMPEACSCGAAVKWAAARAALRAAEGKA